MDETERIRESEVTHLGPAPSLSCAAYPEGISGGSGNANCSGVIDMCIDVGRGKKAVDCGWGREYASSREDGPGGQSAAQTSDRKSQELLY